MERYDTLSTIGPITFHPASYTIKRGFAPRRKWWCKLFLFRMPGLAKRFSVQDLGRTLGTTSHSCYRRTESGQATEQPRDSAGNREGAPGTERARGLPPRRCMPWAARLSFA